MVPKTLSVERSPLKRKPTAIWISAILAILLLLSPWLWECDISDVAAASQPQQLQRALVRIDLPDETALKCVERLGLTIYARLQTANTQSAATPGGQSSCISARTTMAQAASLPCTWTTSVFRLASSSPPRQRQRPRRRAVQLLP